MTNWYLCGGKRFTDLVLSTTALLVLAPLMVFTAAVIRLEDGGAAIFRQKRSGRNGMTFTLFKFRSMGVGSANLPSTHAGGLQITRVGKLIRRTNIDELPQLLNVLRGEMSIVGPRPALPDQVDLLELRRKNGAATVRPGLTGLAQVSSYDAMPVSEKAKFDAEYATHPSLFGDVYIITRTFGYLTRRPPVY
jgi:lipopolysaccharide/colanic/teichoic acid biosynthesis glycosyltransferase